MNAREEAMIERLKHYETLLQQKGIDLSQVTRTPISSTQDGDSRSEVDLRSPEPSLKTSEAQATLFRPQLLSGQGGPKFVDNSLWSRVAEEMHETDEHAEKGSPMDASDDDSGDDDDSQDDFAYVLGWKKPLSPVLHPPAEHVHVLWQTFLENVNPLSKVVHVPSLEPAIKKAVADFDHVPRGFEALMFAIYSMAVLSLTDDVCRTSFQEPRVRLLNRYIAATRAALARARFMSSTSIVVLQALILHILSIRESCEPRAVWSLTGAAIRIAEGMGMRLDGTLLGLSPFETEMQRRIWWQLRMHDFRAAELCGQSKIRAFSIEETAPKPPANVDDRELFPAMTEAATDSTKPTEMIWCMLRTDLACFAASQTAKMRKAGKEMPTSEEYTAMDDIGVKDEFITKIKDLIETKYLRFCDPSQPLQFLTLLGGRASANIIRLVAHHPRRWAKLDHVPAAERQLVWDTVIQLLEQYNMMQTSPQLQCFAWNVPYFIPWHAVIHVLDTLRASPFHTDAAKAWRLIDSLYHNNSATLLGIDRPIFAAVGNLCLKAYNARIAASTKDKSSLPSPPEYITKLRQKQEAAKERRAAALTRNKRQQGLTNVDGPKTMALADGLANGGGVSSQGATAAQSQPYPSTDALKYPAEGIPNTIDDEFWLNTAIDNSLVANNAADAMNVDTDPILSQDYWFEATDNEVIDWAQWDAWLGNQDPKYVKNSAGPQ